MHVNSFQIPNQLVDEYLDQLNGNELKILLVVIRKTKGWNKEYDGISISQFKQLTGIKDERTIRKSIKKLIDLGLIEKVDNAGKFSLYRLTPPTKNDGGQKMQGVAKNAPTPPAKNVGTPPAKNAPHKYTLPKDTITKDINKKEKKVEKKEKETFAKNALEKSEIKTSLNELKVDETFLYELINYREQIGKPFKTIKMLSRTLKDIQNTMLKLSKSANEVFDIMQEQGWKTIKAEWVWNLEGANLQNSHVAKKNSGSFNKGFDEERAISESQAFLEEMMGGGL